MIEKFCSKWKLINIWKQINDEKFLFVQQIQCHMVIRTFYLLDVLTILVPILSAPQRRPKPPPLHLYIDPI